MLGTVYHLPLRQTEGLVRSIMALMGFRRRVPHHSTLSRRRKRLDIERTEPSSNGATDTVIDATGLKRYGAGEWCADQHCGSRCRWRKLSISLDPESGDIVAHCLTDSNLGDPELVETLLDAGERPIRRFFADGAFDGEPVYQTVRRYQADGETSIVIPPRQTATVSGNRDGPTERDCHIEMIRKHGRMAWQRATDYGRRSMVEIAIGRYKAVVGDRLRARDDDAQITEVVIGVKILNRMTCLAKPVFVRVG